MYRSSVRVTGQIEPWRQSQNSRLQQLHLGARRVLFYYERPDTSTFRYRVYNMIQALRDGPDVGAPAPSVAASWFCQNDLAHAETFLGAADVLVICRVRYDAHVGALIHRARERGLRVLFDVDDLVFNTEYVHLLMHTLDVNQNLTSEWNHWFAYVGRLGATLKLCDGVIVTNRYLAAEAHAYSGLPTYVLPNFMNKEQLAISEVLFVEKQARLQAKAEDGQQGVCLGYFSGSPTHNKDFEVISDALARLMDRWPLLTVRAIGFLDIRGQLARHASRVDVRPLTDFLSLQRLIAEVDVNMVPLRDNVFTNCKSELKYFEAAAVGTASIMSPTHVYKQCIEDGVNGYLARTYDWEQQLEAVVARPDELPAVARAARKHAVATFCPAAQRAAIASTLWPELEVDQIATTAPSVCQFDSHPASSSRRAAG